MTAGYEHSWGTESTSASEQTVSQLEEKSRAFTETSATGSMAAGIKVSNIGNISVQVVDLGWTARQWRPNTNFDRFDTSPGEYRTFAALGVDLGPGLTLAPGADSGVLLASADDLNADRVKEFMAKPDSLQLEPAAFELINSEGINFAFIEEITRARTARVTIDFGDSSFEEYRVATNVDRNADGTLAGIKMAKVMDLTVGPGNWETRPAVPPCDNLIVNGSFESPEGSGEPDDWNVRELGDGSGEVSVLEGLDPPDGDQWLEFRNNTTGAKAISQMIGTVQDNAEHSYSLWDAVNDSPPWLYGVSIWAGDPASGGTLLDEDIILTTGEPEAPSQVTGMLNTGAGFEGQDLYVEIRHLPGEFAILLIDDFNISGPGGSLGVLWRVRDVSTELDATPRFWFVVVSGENVDDTLPFEDTVLRNGDSVLIALTQDEDGDGLYAAQEQQYGTLDDVPDTDGDGLTDPQEAARTYIDQQTCEILEGGWEVVVTDRSQNVTRSIVYSDPRVKDSDLDGVSDGDERLGLDGLPPDDENDSDDATDPNRRDTDLDGLTDDVDPLPTIQASILFVKEGNGGTNGNNWGDAFSTITQAAAVANARNADQDDTNDVSEIWVTSGTYQQLNVPLPDSAAIYGGFAGIETRLGQRVAEGLVNGSIIVGLGGSAFSLPLGGPAVNSRLDGFTIQNSIVGMTLESVGSTVEIANCFFAQNQAFTSDAFFSGGSAIRAAGTNLTLEDCIFSENVGIGLDPARLTAGAVAVNGGSLTVRGCTFLQNLAVFGTRGTAGGALFAVGDGTPSVSIEDTTFTNNTSVPGGIFGRGGAVYLQGVKANVVNCSFQQNAVEQGESVLGGDPSGYFHSLRAGGAVALVAVQANFVNCQFIDNRAPIFGGGLYADVDSQARVVNCSFFGNEAYPNVKPGDTVKADRSTCFSGVQITPLAVGGAIGSEGSTTIVNTAIWDNLGTRKVEIRVFGQTFELGNWGIEQQVAGRPQVRFENSACLSSQGSVGFAHSAVPTVAGYNKSFAVDVTISSSVFSGVSNIVPSDPGFVNADGGNLRLTSSSPLIDAGNQIVDVDFNIFGFQLLPEFDFDGNFRITDGDGSGGEEVDIGAFEFQGGE